MTDAPLKPKRKRWRWIIAGVLLCVVGFTAWWHWPRGDARFVGKWEMIQEGATVPDRVLELRRNGLGTKTWINGAFCCDYFWTGDSKSLLIGKGVGPLSVDQYLFNWLSRARGRTFYREHGESYRVRSITDREIVVIVDGQTAVLRRIPE